MRLIAFDTKGGKSPFPGGGFQACEKLRPQLAPLLGTGGFRTLLERALALATRQIPGLRIIHVKADGTLEVPKEFQQQVNADKYFEGRVVILTQLLGLLVAFIGEDLTFHLVREIWPRVSLDDLNSEVGGMTGKEAKYEKGAKHEKAK